MGFFANTKSRVRPFQSKQIWIIETIMFIVCDLFDAHFFLLVFWVGEQKTRHVNAKHLRNIDCIWHHFVMIARHFNILTSVHRNQCLWHNLCRKLEFQMIIRFSECLYKLMPFIEIWQCDEMFGQVLWWWIDNVPLCRWNSDTRTMKNVSRNPVEASHCITFNAMKSNKLLLDYALQACLKSGFLKVKYASSNRLVKEQQSAWQNRNKMRLTLITSKCVRIFTHLIWCHTKKIGQYIFIYIYIYIISFIVRANEIK